MKLKRRKKPATKRSDNSSVALPGDMVAELDGYTNPYDPEQSRSSKMRVLIRKALAVVRAERMDASHRPMTH